MSPSQNSPARDGLLPPQPVRWGLPDSAVVLAIGVLAIVGTLFLARATWVPHTDLVGIAVQTLFYVVLAAALFVVVRRRGLGGFRRDFGLELKWIDFPIGVGLTVAINLADILVYYFAVAILGLPKAPTSNVELPKSRVLAVIDALAIAAFLGPIVEELLFRGLIMRSIRNFVIRHSTFEGSTATRWGKRASVVVSALIFAAAHLYEARNPTMLFVLGVSIFIFGLITAAIATRTGRLGPSMLTHMFVNGFAAVTLLTTR